MIALGVRAAPQCLQAANEKPEPKVPSATGSPSPNAPAIPYHPPMVQSVRRLTIALALLTALALPAAASAQQPATPPFLIEFDKSLTFLPDNGVIRAFIGLTECAINDFQSNDWTLVVGGPGTPDACNQPWRVVNLVPDESVPLGNDPIFQPGQTVTITTINPFPSTFGPDLPPFFIEVAPPDLDEASLPAYQPFTAYVGGVNCGSASLATIQAAPLAVPVGAAGTPDVCRELGAEITLVNAYGNVLVVRPSVGPGPYYRLTNPAPGPVWTGTPTPTAVQDPNLAPFTIKFDRSLTSLVNYEVIRAFMGVTECSSLDLTQPDWTLVVGGPDTPKACNQPWRVINLIPDRNGLLEDAPIFMPGETLTISTDTGFAFIDGPPLFFIRGGDNLTPTDIAALASLTAHVGGVVCGSASPADIQAGFLHLLVGATGTPDICRETGAEVTLVNGVDGPRLAIRLSVRPGLYRLTNLTLDPLGPTPSPAGSAGLQRTSTASHALELLLAAIALTILARHLTAKR